METIILRNADFIFILEDETIVTVKWLHLGRAYIDSKEYATTWKVHVNYANDGYGTAFTVSVECNYRNSLRLLKKAMISPSKIQ